MMTFFSPSQTKSEDLQSEKYGAKPTIITIRIIIKIIGLNKIFTITPKTWLLSYSLKS